MACRASRTTGNSSDDAIAIGADGTLADVAGLELEYIPDTVRATSAASSSRDLAEFPYSTIGTTGEAPCEQVLWVRPKG